MGKEMEGVQEEETCVHPWLIDVDVWQKPPQYCKVISLQLNKNFLKTLSTLEIKSTTNIILNGERLNAFLLK